MAEPSLELQALTLLGPEGHPFLQDASVQLESGAKVQLRGGAARGTLLLQACAGLVKPATGRILLGGIPLPELSFLHPWIQRGAIGWVPTGGGLLVNQTLRANVALPLRFHRGLSKSEAERRAEDSLEHWNLTSRADSRPHALDPLERWLGALARAWAMEADLWLVDRPPSSLEPEEVHGIAERLKAVRGAVLTLVPLGPSAHIPIWHLREAHLTVEIPHAT